jgi:ribonuclease P protein component
MTAPEDNSATPIRYTFSKEERLCSKKVIQELFQKGSSFTLYPFRIIYTTSASEQAAWPQVLFSVPKRNFKRATDRNLIKRRCREAYRLHKYLLANQAEPVHLHKVRELAIIYTAKEIISYNIIEKKLSLALQRLANTCRSSG